MSRLPQPLSVTGRVTFDPVTRSLLAKPAEPGLGSLIWRQGHEAMMGDVHGALAAHPPAVYGRIGHRDVGRGEPVRDGWLRFQLNESDYRQLTRQDGVHAILTVDKQVGHILSVRFIG
jgi:hypothetical protein